MSGYEPYEARVVSNWLLARGARQLPDVKGVHVFEVAPGRIVKVPVGDFPTDLARRIASVLGMSYADFRMRLGHPVIAGGRPSRNVVKTKPQGRSKSDVLSCSRDAHRVLTQVEQAVKPGVRDSAFYGRVHEHLTEAKRLIDLALSEATSTGTRRSA